MTKEQPDSNISASGPGLRVWLRVGLVCAMWALFPFVLMVLGHRYEETFADLGVTLPAITVFIVDLAVWFRGDYPTPGSMMLPGLVWFALPWLVPCAICTLLSRSTEHKSAGAMLCQLMGVASTLGYITMLLALRLPLVFADFPSAPPF